MLVKTKTTNSEMKAYKEKLINIFLRTKLCCVPGGIYSGVWRGCSDRADHHHRPHPLSNSSMQTETAGATPEVC